MSKPKKILVLSHNPARDYQSDSVFAAELKKRGHVVWLAKFLDDDGRRICTIKPDIVIVPEIRNEYTLYLAQQCKAYGIQIVVKMCEFGITEESIPFITEDYRQAIFGRFDLNKCVDLFLAWGDKMKWQMEKYAAIDGKKIVPCGGFQFDHYFLPPPPIQIADKKTILFASGFPYADKNERFSIPEAPPDTPIQSFFVRQDGQARGKWLDILRRFIPDHQDWHIIVKPHPGECIEPYQAVLGNDGYVLEHDQPGYISLLKADMLVHAGSTMAYEAHLRNIPSVNLHNNCLDVIVSKISPMVYDYDALNEFVQRHEGGHSTADASILDIMHRDYYGIVDGKGYLRICDAIETLPDNETSIPDNWKYPAEFRFPSFGVMEYAEQWRCDGCRNSYLIIEPSRTMVKCPYCGIANVKFMKG